MDSDLLSFIKVTKYFHQKSRNYWVLAVFGDDAGHEIEVGVIADGKRGLIPVGRTVGGIVHHAGRDEMVFTACSSLDGMVASSASATLVFLHSSIKAASSGLLAAACCASGWPAATAR